MSHVDSSVNGHASAASATMAPPGGASPAAAERGERLVAAALALLSLDDAAAIRQRALDDAAALLRADAGSFWPAEGGLLERGIAFGSGEPPVADVVPVRAVEALGVGDHETSVAVALVGTRAAARGALRLCRRLDGAPPFDAGEREALGRLASLVDAALDAAARHALDAARGRSLALVAEMSREVTATLDLDRVLRATVNLAARALTFDRGALALYEDGTCDVRAVAGADTVDRAEPALQDLAARAAWAAGVGDALYVSDRDDPGSDAERIFLQFFSGDLEHDGVRSALYVPLRDEEGIVGVLVLEAAAPDFAGPAQREVVTILANQATVAIRNARLYSQVPLAGVLGAIGDTRQALRAVPRQRRLAVGAIVVAALAGLTLIRWPLRVDAEAPVLRAGTRADVRPLVGGVVERVFVPAGAPVERGAPLLQLADGELRAQRDALLADVGSADREAAVAAARGDAAGARDAGERAAERRADAALLDEQLRGTVVRAPVDGVVLTDAPEERLGIYAAPGALLLQVGRLDTLELEFTVSQRDVARVEPGDVVRLRVDALPQRTFEGRVTALGPAAPDSTAPGLFPVRAVVPNADALLRPGMLPAARVLTRPASTAERLLRSPSRWARMFWWRIST